MSEEPETASFPRVDADIAAYDKTTADMRAKFALIPADPKDKEWVKKKIKHMCDIDQFMRYKIDLPFKHKYSKEEEQHFWKQFVPRFEALDSSNTHDVKELLKRYGWFKISEFGEESDQNAWLLVQHADLDVAFQKEVLKKLEMLYPQGETRAGNYAFLFDRVAVNEKRPQRYGTQGRCVDPGKWEPLPLEDPERVAELRKSMGMDSLEETKKRNSALCH